MSWIFPALAFHSGARGPQPCRVLSEVWSGACLCVGQFRSFNTFVLRQNSCHFAGDIFKCIFLNENVSISIEIQLKFVHSIPVLVQIMARRRPGGEPSLESVMVRLLKHICQLVVHWEMWQLCENIIFTHFIQATSHYLNQWWLVYWCIYASLGLNELISDCSPYLTRWGQVTGIYIWLN